MLLTKARSAKHLLHHGAPQLWSSVERHSNSTLNLCVLGTHSHIFDRSVARVANQFLVESTGLSNLILPIPINDLDGLSFGIGTRNSKVSVIATK